MGRPQKIIMEKKVLDVLLGHCQRKLAKKYLENELPEQKAYGLMGGTIQDDVVTIEKIFPLFKNGRYDLSEKRKMDNKLEKYAVASETPMEQRGWVVDNKEMGAILQDCAILDLEIFASYHMHRVPWDHDPIRDTPTSLDTQLAKDSEIMMCIISIVDPNNPIVRFFYEGIGDQEVEFIIKD